MTAGEPAGGRIGEGSVPRDGVWDRQTHPHPCPLPRLWIQYRLLHQGGNTTDRQPFGECFRWFSTEEEDSLAMSGQVNDVKNGRHRGTFWPNREREADSSLTPRYISLVSVNYLQ